jgi:hypothetical protein
MRNHLQIAGIREGALGIRRTMWGAWIPWKNWKAVTVSLQVGCRRRPPAASRFVPTKKINTHKLLSLRRSITQDLRSIIQSIKIRIFYFESTSRYIDSTFWFHLTSSSLPGCTSVWGLTLPVLVLAVSLNWLLTRCPPDGNRHTPKAGHISVA